MLKKLSWKSERKKSREKTSFLFFKYSLHRRMYKMIVKKTNYVANISNIELKQANPNDKNVVENQLRPKHFLVLKNL